MSGFPKNKKGAAIEGGSRTKLIVVKHHRELKLPSVLHVADWAPSLSNIWSDLWSVTETEEG